MTWGAPFRNGRTVTFRYPTWSADRYGNERPGPPWTDELVAGCAVAPRRSPEDHAAGAQAVIIGLTLYAPKAPGPHDVVVIDGEEFQVDGEPGVWQSPFSGHRPGVEVPLKRVEG